MSSTAPSTLLAVCLALAPYAWGQLGVQSGSYLGVGVIEVDQAAAQRARLDAPRGVEVANVAAGSPAEKAGLRRGDVITELRGETVEGVEHFVRLVRETPEGREVEMRVARQGAALSLTATIGRRAAVFSRTPARQLRPRLANPVEVDIPRPSMLVSSRSLGATLESVDGEFARFFGVAEGVLIREVSPGGPAAQAGLQVGDVVIAIEGSTVRRTSDIRTELSRARGETASLDVVRSKARKRLRIETGRRTLTQPLEGARQVSSPN